MHIYLCAFDKEKLNPIYIYSASIARQNNHSSKRICIVPRLLHSSWGIPFCGGSAQVLAFLVALHVQNMSKTPAWRGWRLPRNTARSEQTCTLIKSVRSQISACSDWFGAKDERISSSKMPRIKIPILRRMLHCGILWVLKIKYERFELNGEISV